MLALLSHPNFPLALVKLPPLSHFKSDSFASNLHVIKRNGMPGGGVRGAEGINNLQRRGAFRHLHCNDCFASGILLITG